MKKIIYSDYTKAVAVILFIISIVSGVRIVSNGVSKFIKEKEFVYAFESDFSESEYFTPLLDAPENVIFNAYNKFYDPDGETESADGEMPLTVNGQTIEENIEQRLNDLYCADKINYYIKLNDKVFTNCGAQKPEELMQGDFYSYISKDETEHIERESKPLHNRYSEYMIEKIPHYDKTGTITMCTNIKKDYAEEYRVIWERQAAIANKAITQILFVVVFAVLLLIYLICVCGKNKDGEQKTIRLDNIWAEIHLSAIGVFGIGAVCIFIGLLDEYISGHFPLNLFNLVVGTSLALASAVILTSLLSIIRNIKCRRFLKSSVIFRIAKWIWMSFIKAVKWFHKKLQSYEKTLSEVLSQKTGIILISRLFVYTAVIGLCGIFAGVFESVCAFWIFVAVLFFGFACFAASYRAKDLDEIKKGVSEVRNGNTAYKIIEPKSEDMKILAENINDIAKGLDESVSAKLKAERLKTDLITNVSHDLKTPLTSIISYTELLSKVDDLPEEAKDYVQVISKKSERLKNLTQDLFDISKVQSGNEDVVLEKLDVSLLINQSLGELDSEIKKSELPFCVDTPKELYISADGRKMSRVVSNLINNILKYSMKNTRVFITSFEKDGEIIMEFKNISSYPMDFNADEIVGRFVRGDESRTAEGNGLGLAIAKSYTEICNGQFEVIIDGDMFKAIIKFRKYK